jgi:iron complex outermembrane recepter protein
MEKLPSFLNYNTPLIAALLLASAGLGVAQAEEIAINPTSKSVVARKEQLAEAVSNSAETLGQVAKPLYDISGFVSPAPQTLDELYQSAGKPEFIEPDYKVEMFSPKAIAQAKKPEPSKPVDDDSDILDEVNVKGARTRSPEQSETSPKYTVKKEEITATGEPTVSGVLRKLLPSFSATESLGGINTDQGVFLRGLGSNRFLVLIDGRQTTRPSNNRSADLGRLGVSNIERIEIITGAAALRYGSGAIAGAINIITQVPVEEKLVLSAEGGSYGFNRDTVIYTNTNGLKLGIPGYIGYEVNYERRSALNNYIGTAVEQSTGIGTLFNPETAPPPRGVIPENASFNQVEFDDGTRNFYTVPISYQKLLRNAYVFSDDYSAKIVYQPAIDHILRASFAVRSTRTGDQFRGAQLGECVVFPAGFGFSPEIGGRVLNPGDQNFYTYKRCTGIISLAAQREAFINFPSNDNAEDTITASLGWEWKLTDVSKLNFLGSFAAAFETNPSSPGARIVSSNIYDFQLNYSSELSPRNTFNAGVEYFQQRYNATPTVGSGGNQLIPFRNSQGILDANVLPLPAVDITKSSLAFYITDQWRFFDDALIVDLGSRTTFDQFFGTFTTPGAGLRWSFGGSKGQEPFAFRASWFQSFRAPGLADIFGFSGFNIAQNTSQSSSGVPNIFRNLALREETGTSYDFGLDIKISPKSLFRITYFRTDLNNAILGNVLVSPLPDLIFDDKLNRTLPYAALPVTLASCGNASPAPIVSGQSTCNDPLTNINAQSYLSTGWEFSYRWQIIEQLELSASYSFVDSRPVGDARLNTITDIATGAKIPLGSGGLNGGFLYGYQPVDIPFTTGNFGLRYTSHGYRVALSTTFVGLRPRAAGGNNYYLPYSRWDITFGIPLSEELTFTGGAFNIFGDQSVLGDVGSAIGSGSLLPPATFRFGIEAAFVTR